MPLLVSVEQDAPLNQGNLFEGVPVCRTAADGTSASRVSRVVLLSRACKAIRAEYLLVAEVKPVKMQDFNVDSLDHCRRFLLDIRDASQSPDRFYVGNFPGEETRFQVSLDVISMVHRDLLSQDARLATLSPDALLALQVRLYNSVARVGFDDHEWLPDEDLKALISAGQVGVSELELAIAKANKALSLSIAKGEDARKVNGMRTEIGKNEKKLSETKAQLEPYLKEQQRRTDVS